MVFESYLGQPTKNLTATAPVEEVHQKTTSTSTEVSFSPVQAATSGPVGLLPTVSHAETKTESHSKKVHPTRIKTNEANIEVKKNAHLKGAHLEARKARIHVKGDLTVESSPDTHRENSHSSGFSVSMNAVAGVGQALGKIGKGGVAQAGNSLSKTLNNVRPISAIPTYQEESQTKAQQHVKDRAGIVADHLDLTVDGTVKKRSADVKGTRSSRIQTGPTQTEEIPTFSTAEEQSFVVPVADVLALGGAINDLVIVRRQTFESLQEQGLTDSEAMEAISHPAVKECMNRMAKRSEQLQKEVQASKASLDKTKTQSPIKSKASEANLVESVEDQAETIHDQPNALGDQPNALGQAVLTVQQWRELEYLKQKADEALLQDIKEIEELAKLHPECKAAVPEALRKTAWQRRVDLFEAFVNEWMPFCKSFHEAFEGNLWEAAQLGSRDLALCLVPIGKIAKTAFRPVQTMSKSITQALEKQAQRFGAKVVASKKVTGLFKKPDIMTRGMEYENYVAGELSGRLKPGHPVFDFFDRKTRHAVSVKSMDTQTAARLADPTQVYKALRENINKTINYTGKGGTFLPDEILSRELRVGIPLETNQAQWQQILQAVQYGKSRGVSVVVEVLK